MKRFVRLTAFACALAVFAPAASLAQAVGGADVPSDAASQGAKENGPGSTGGKGAMKGGMMKKKHHSMKKKKHM